MNERDLQLKEFLFKKSEMKLRNESYIDKKLINNVLLKKYFENNKNNDVIKFKIKDKNKNTIFVKEIKKLNNNNQKNENVIIEENKTEENYISETKTQIYLSDINISEKFKNAKIYYGNIYSREIFNLNLPYNFDKKYLSGEDIIRREKFIDYMNKNNDNYFNKLKEEFINKGFFLDPIFITNNIENYDKKIKELKEFKFVCIQGSCSLYIAQELDMFIRSIIIDFKNSIDEKIFTKLSNITDFFNNENYKFLIDEKSEFGYNKVDITNNINNFVV
jgi:hypothetical protein